MKEGKKAFWIFLGLFIFIFLLLSFMSYKYYDCKCYEGQSFSEWSSRFICSSDSGYTRSCASWSDSGMEFSIFIILFILSVGLFGLIIFMIFKFFKTGLLRPNLSEEQKEKTTKQLDFLQNMYRFESIFYLVTLVYLSYLVFKILSYGKVSYSLVWILVIILFSFICYKNTKWFIDFYDRLIKKLRS